ncbi:MAG TPA: hypothetical protein PKD54_01015 [Pirellulaceae bacterium]|nr:hypothetical protein [Pirellulaceae bacterium]
MRITILIIILLAVTGLFAYDRYVMVPKGEKIIDQLGVLSTKPKDSVGRAEVQALVGSRPVKSTPVEGTELVIEEYRMPRVLPFQQGTPVWVIFKNANLYKFSTEEQTPDNVVPKVTRGEFDPDNIPFVLGGSGGPPPNRGNNDEQGEGDDSSDADDKKDDQEKAEDEDDQSGDKVGDGEQTQESDADQDQEKGDGDGK